MNEINSLNNKEMCVLMKYIFPNDINHLDFHEFSRKIRPNLFKTDYFGNQIIHQNLTPNIKYHENIKNFFPEINKNRKKIIDSLKPENYS